MATKDQIAAAVERRLNKAQLDSIRVLWRGPAPRLVLWGIPYAMRPGQSPYDLWKAYHEEKDRLSRSGWYGREQTLNLNDWVPLEPSYREDIQAFLRKHAADVPQNHPEWSELALPRARAVKP